MHKPRSPRRGRTSSWLLLLALATPFRAQAWYYEGHRKIVALTVELAGTNLPAFFRQGLDLMQDCSGDPDAFRDLSPEDLKKAEGPEHFIDCEMLAGAALPPTRYEFVALCAQRRLDPAAVGCLPYAVAEWEQRLGVALAEYRRWPDKARIQQKALVYAGLLGHYAGDLCQPLHVTVHYNGRQQPDGQSPRTGIHNKVDDLPGKAPFPFRELLTPPINVAPCDRVMPCILGALEATRGQVDRVYRLEPKLPKEGEPLGDDPEVRAFTRESLRVSARFLAALYLTAWKQSADLVLPPWLDGKGDGTR